MFEKKGEISFQQTLLDEIDFVLFQVLLYREGVKVSQIK